MSKDREGLNAGRGIGEHRTARDTERITYERARSAGASRERARRIAQDVARNVHSSKD